MGGAISPLNQSFACALRLRELPASLVVRSVGYKGLTLDSELPFDSKRGTVAHQQGRVLGWPGVFTTGWIKTGPVGVILSTMSDAQQTADAVLTDLPQLPVVAGDADIMGFLANRGVDVSDGKCRYVHNSHEFCFPLLFSACDDI